MRVAEIQFASWDKVYYFSLNSLDIIEGDKVIVNTELGNELGEVVGFAEVSDEEYTLFSENTPKGEKKIIKPILRKATAEDQEKNPGLSDKRKALEICRSLKERYDLPMKFIDAHFSFDNSRVTFAFIADGRIDFRELVKELTRRFGKTIRLQQIGIRDEAKIMGDCGHCGKPLCCKSHLSELSSITSEMAELQQCSHRGSERISGVCGRLMCCLSYEEQGYEELAKKLPPMSAKVDVDGQKGVVVGHHVLKQSVDVRFPGEKGAHDLVIEVDLNRKNKKKD